jgi:hypothetical protein
MVKYNKAKKVSYDRDPGRVARAKNNALKKAMGDTRPNGGQDCFYGDSRHPKFCTAHLRNH